MGVLNLKQYAMTITELVEEILEEHGVEIPEEEYDLVTEEIEQNTKETLERLMVERDQYDECEYETVGY